MAKFFLVDFEYEIFFVWKSLLHYFVVVSLWNLFAGAISRPKNEGQ